MATHPGVWTTHREIEFLRGLGSHRPKEFRRGWFTRQALLRLYLTGIDEPKRWELVEKHVVRTACKMMIEGRDEAIGVL